MKNDLTGQRFGRLTVIKEAKKKPGNNNRRWLCQCDCGNTCEVFGQNLRTKHTKSCGCALTDMLQKRNTTHGQEGTRLYRIWSHVKGRCNNKTDFAYPDYGGRGITVCPEWRDSFEAFRDWALANGYRDDLTLDRENNDGPYSPENCRWATDTQQANNMRSNKLYTVNGVTKTQREWEITIGVYRGKLWKIRAKGESVENFIKQKLEEKR